MILNRIMNAIKDLKDKTDDTGWIDCELEDGISGATSGYGGPAGIQYRQIGKVVYVRGSISATYDGSNTLLLTTLPYTPDYRTYVFDVLTGARIARLYIKQNGNLCLEWIRALSDGSVVTSEQSWIAVKLDFTVD